MFITIAQTLMPKPFKHGKRGIQLCKAFRHIWHNVCSVQCALCITQARTYRLLRIIYVQNQQSVGKCWLKCNFPNIYIYMAYALWKSNSRGEKSENQLWRKKTQIELHATQECFAFSFGWKRKGIFFLLNAKQLHNFFNPSKAFKA